MNKKDIEAIFPLSHQQKGMFVETLLAPGSGIHIEQALWAFDGTLDVAAFRQAWQAVMVRHAMLRTAFVWKDRPEPLQVTLRSAEMPFEQFDLRQQAPEAQKAFIETFVRDAGHKGFDLRHAPLMGLALFQTGEGSFQIAWTSHHILMDGWCRQMVLQEVLAAYQALCAGQTPQLPPGPPYQGYIAWLKRQDMARAEQFWRQTLAGLSRPTPLGKPTADAETGVVAEPYETQTLRLPAADTQALVALSQKAHVTLNTLLQGVWALLLARYSGSEDVLFGTTVSGRPADLPGSESIVGLFITTLPFRVQVPPGEALWPWLKQLQAQHLQLRSYEYCSEGQIHPWSGLPGGQALFESILVFENYPGGFSASGLPAGADTPDAAGSASLSGAAHTGARTKYALTLLAIPGTQLELQLVADRRRFAPGQPLAVLEHCAALLTGLPGAGETRLGALLETIPAGQIPTFRAKAARQPQEDAAFEAPRTQTEKDLANVFSRLLNVEQIGRDENFFGVGGHSLMALQLVNRVQETFQVDLPLQASFEAPTIAELARRIEQAQQAARQANSPAIQPLPADAQRPLSFAQQAIWDLLYPPAAEKALPSSSGFLRGLFATHKSNGGNHPSPWQHIYPIVASLHLDGTLERHALEQALHLLCQRHEALRTRFVLQEDGQVFQELSPDEQGAVALRLLPLPGASCDGESLQGLIQRERNAPFDPGQGQLWRATLVGLANEQRPSLQHLLLLTLHPLIADGPSAHILVRDLAALYAASLSATPDGLPALPVQYADYAAWQRKQLGAAELQKQLGFWQQTLAGYKPLFPTRHAPGPRPLHAAGPAFTLPKPQVEALKALSQQFALPWHLLLAATFQALLYRCTNQPDIALALPVPHRPHPGSANLAGPFANYLTLRSFFTDQTRLPDLLQQLRQAFAAGFANQDAPFEQISPAQVQVLFAVEDQHPAPLPAPGLAFSGLRLAGSEQNFELCLALHPAPAACLAGHITYNPQWFDAATIERFSGDYQALLGAILDAPASPIAALPLGAVPVG